MSKHIILVGVGALGSHVALLGRNLDARWTLIDFDRVEQKNTLSQQHTRLGLGRNKAQAMAQSLQGLFNHRVEAIPHKVTSDNAEVLLGGADLLLDCLDNGAGRRLVQGVARSRGIPCLHGALAADGSFGRVVWDGDFAVDDEDVAGQPTCEGGEHLPFIAWVAACMTQRVKDFLASGEQRSLNLLPNAVIPLS